MAHRRSLPAGRGRVNPGDAASGTVIAAAPAANAVNVAIPPPRAVTQAVGEPRLELSYKGTGSASSGRVFAQIVDEKRGVALGNQVTPVPVTLDGQAHSVTRSLEGAAASIAGRRALPAPDHRRQPGLRPGPRRCRDRLLLDPPRAADGVALRHQRPRRVKVRFARRPPG